MKYITSCPKCDTHFLLNDELVSAHRGKVQCGTCEHVFNAKTRLTEVADDVTSADEYQASLAETEAVDTEEAFEHKESKSTPEHFIGEDTTITTDPEPTLELNAPTIFDDLNLEDNNSKKNKRHPAFWGVISLLLIVLAAAQTIYHQRVNIAAQYPQFKPLLVKACIKLNCTVDLPKNLELITIGDSDMQEDDNYQSVINFSSSITNKSNYVQTYPNIELTLTNESDQTVIKKIIRPDEYLASEEAFNKGLAAREVSPIKLKLYIHEAVVAGYRILLTY